MTQTLAFTYNRKIITTSFTGKKRKNEKKGEEEKPLDKYELKYYVTRLLFKHKENESHNEKSENHP